MPACLFACSLDFCSADNNLRSTNAGELGFYCMYVCLFILGLGVVCLFVCFVVVVVVVHFGLVPLFFSALEETKKMWPIVYYIRMCS